MRDEPDVPPAKEELLGVSAVVPVTCVIIDNHELVLDAFTELARSNPDRLAVVGCYTDVTDVELGSQNPQVVVLDLYLGRDDRPSTPWIPRLVDWGAQVLLHTSAEFPIPVRQAVAAGAAGLTLKNDGTQALLETILDVAQGEFACSSTIARALLTDSDLVVQLTPREIEVIRGIDDGLTHRQIGRRHSVAESTIKEHLKSVRAKYVAEDRQITNAISLVREARRDGYLN